MSSWQWLSGIFTWWTCCIFCSIWIPVVCATCTNYKHARSVMIRPVQRDWAWSPYMPLLTSFESYWILLTWPTRDALIAKVRAPKSPNQEESVTLGPTGEPESIWKHVKKSQSKPKYCTYKYILARSCDGLSSLNSWPNFGKTPWHYKLTQAIKKTHERYYSKDM